MIAEILCVGTELLMGQVLNTNAQFLSRRLSALGISQYHQTVVGDNAQRLEEAYRLALSRADVALSIGVSAAVLVLFGLFYHQLFAITFDESFSRATGMKVGVYNTLLAVLTALTIVLGMRLMGAMLISSLVIFPALTAMRLKKSFFGVVILAGCLSVVCFCVGLIGSYLLSLPVGASVVVTSLAAFLAATVIGHVRGRS